MFADKSTTECIVKSVTPEGVATRVRIVFHPFKLELLVGDSKKPSIVVNDANRLYFEQRKDRKHVDKASERSLGSDAQSGDDEREILDWGEDGKPIYKDDAGQSGEAAADGKDDASAGDNADVNDPDAAESFGGHTDSKPHGKSVTIRIMIGDSSVGQPRGNVDWTGYKIPGKSTSLWVA